MPIALVLRLAQWRQQFPNITEQEALADLWHKGYHFNETLAAMKQRKIEQLNAEYGVVSHPDELRGWHLASCKIYKRGVYRIVTTRGMECCHGYATQAVVTTAIEQGICSRPNGFMQP